MSNKETLQNYNNRLSANNTSLNEILEIVEGLPKITEPILQDKIIEITENGTQTITADEGYDGLKSITITTQTTPAENIKDYQLVQYIQSTSYEHNTNYIDTEIVANNNTTIEIKFAYNDTTTEYSRIYGGDGNYFRTETSSNYGTHTIFCWNNKIYQYEGWGSANLNTNIIKQDKNLLYANGTLINTFPEAAWEDTANLRLFSAYGGNRDSLIRVYYCKIWDNNVLVRDFVPCYRKTDGVIGMFDKVKNKFYENKGSVAFAKGSDITAV
jgi:hypothetical protein